VGSTTKRTIHHETRRRFTAEFKAKVAEVTALATTTAAIKEWLGFIVYRCRRWA
jgi:hypothetical protein